MEQTERIRQMEQRLDRASSAVMELAAALDKYAGVQEAIAELDRYYSSKEWRQHFEDDEAGLLPPDLKRGVLSEDAIWNLLSDHRELVTRMQEIVAKGKQKINMAIFVSGGGTNCENLIRYFQNSPRFATSLVVSNKADAYALVRAERLGVPTAVVSKAELNTPEVLMPLLQQYGIDFVVLAGFLPLVPDFLIDAFPRRIVNLHPALLPKFGGKGMWGHHVHEAVKAAGETETGMTVHYVTPVCDSGEIIAQFRVSLSPDDSADDIAAKEHLLEMEHFPKVVEQVLYEAFPTDFPTGSPQGEAQHSC